MQADVGRCRPSVVVGQMLPGFGDRPSLGKTVLPASCQILYRLDIRIIFNLRRPFKNKSSPSPLKERGIQGVRLKVERGGDAI